MKFEFGGVICEYRWERKDKGNGSFLWPFIQGQNVFKLGRSPTAHYISLHKASTTHYSIPGCMYTCESVVWTDEVFLFIPNFLLPWCYLLVLVSTCRSVQCLAVGHTGTDEV